MSFCQKCGAEVVLSAAFCGACGTMVVITPIQPSLVGTEAPPVVKESESWKKKFALIEKAGGAGLPKWRELTFGEKNIIRINLWAFVWGPFYYIAMGMWKKGVVMFFLCTAVLILLAFTFDYFGREMNYALNYATGIIYAQRATLDFYKKVVCGDNGWW